MDPSRKPVVIAGTLVSVTGSIAFIASACSMIYMWAALLTQAIGWIGAVVGILTAPLAAVYPFLHWIIRGNLPQLVLVVWASGVAGALVSMWWASWGRVRFVQDPLQTATPTKSFARRGDR